MKLLGQAFAHCQIFPAEARIAVVAIFSPHEAEAPPRPAKFQHFKKTLPFQETSLSLTTLKA